MLTHESAVQLIPTLRPLIAPGNSITALQNSNTLIITDYAGNLQRLAEIIDAIDQPAETGPAMIALHYASALDAAQTINRLFANAPQALQTLQGSDPTQRVSIVADARSNSLLVRAADPARLAQIRKFAAMLDSPTSAAGNIHVVYLKNAEAVKIAETLRGIYAGTVAQPTAATSNPAAPSGTAAADTAVDAATGTQAAADTTPSPSGASTPGIIQADAATNSIIITAPDALYNNLRAAVEKLDARRLQVYVEALIVELTASKAGEFGIQWQDLGGIGETGTHVFGGTNFGGAGQNIIGIAQNPASAGPGLNLGVMHGTVAIGGVRDPQPGPARARAGNGQQREHPVHADPAHPRQRGSQDRGRPERALHHRPVRGLRCGDHANAVPDHRAQGRRADLADPPADLRRRRRAPADLPGGLQHLRHRQHGRRHHQQALDRVDRAGRRRADHRAGRPDPGFRQRRRVQGAACSADIPLVGGLFRYNTRSRTKTNLMVFLRPTMLRDAQHADTLTGDRYDYIRGQQLQAAPTPGATGPANPAPLLPSLPGSPVRADDRR